MILRVSAKIAAHCTGGRSSPDFHRFKLIRGDDREIIDVVVDRAAQVDALKASVDSIRVDTLREILANKLSTLVIRSELKDLVDLYFLEMSGCDLLAAIPDARAKDAGWEPAVVSMLLDEMHVEVPPEWLIREVSVGRVGGLYPEASSWSGGTGPAVRLNISAHQTAGHRARPRRSIVLSQGYEFYEFPSASPAPASPCS